jgi:hypothetical protein
MITEPALSSHEDRSTPTSDHLLLFFLPTFFFLLEYLFLWPAFFAPYRRVYAFITSNSCQYKSTRDRIWTCTIRHRSEQTSTLRICQLHMSTKCLGRKWLNPQLSSKSLRLHDSHDRPAIPMPSHHNHSTRLSSTGYSPIASFSIRLHNVSPLAPRSSAS